MGTSTVSGGVWYQRIWDRKQEERGTGNIRDPRSTKGIGARVESDTVYLYLTC